MDMTQQVTHNYAEAIGAIKQAILKSRYNAAVLVNREMLMLYFGVGEYISRNSREGTWGTNAIDHISTQLQKELPGLRGFSATNIKRMRTFFETWESTFANRPLPTDEIEWSAEIAQRSNNEIIINRPLVTDDLEPDKLDAFVRVSFTHHYEILLRAKSPEERLFYIQKCATEFWSVEKLKYNLKSELYAREGKIANNFVATIPDADYRGKALRSFKDEYLMDYINIEDPDEADERVIENQIVLNIKNVIMTFGNDFAFIGNQYMIVVDGQEYFIDLLFFNRRTQSLVAVELKKNEFKPEYAGKLNFYLSALDEYVKMPHENPSIGIVLCKSQKEKLVEFAFKDISKPMGVATYNLSKELPPEYRGILPDADRLMKVLESGSDQYMPTKEEIRQEQLQKLKSQKELMPDE
jgi:predicted nuclease of restriction endonuclease-like (RecB) superfamily